MTLRNDALDAGDLKFKPGDEVPLETEGTASKGDPVTFADDGRVTTAGDGEDFIGQLGDSPRFDGDVVRVVMAGPLVVADAGEAFSAGDYAIPAGGGDFRPYDSGTDSTDLQHLPVAMHDAPAGETVVLQYR